MCAHNYYLEISLRQGWGNLGTEVKPVSYLLFAGLWDEIRILTSFPEFPIIIPSTNSFILGVCYLKDNLLSTLEESFPLSVSLFK